MDSTVYIRQVVSSFSQRPGVVRIEQRFAYSISPSRAAVKVRLQFFDDSYMDVEESVDTSLCHPDRRRYAYQYIKGGQQVFRYDNAPHHPEVSTHPHHKHVGPEDAERIEGSPRPNHHDLFREISQYWG